MRLLPAGDQAFEARIALARAAEKTHRRAVLPDRRRRVGPAVPARAARRRRARRARAPAGRRPVRGRRGRAAGRPRRARRTSKLRMFNPLPVRDGSVGLARAVLAARVLAHQPAHAQQAVRRRQRVRRSAVAATSPTNTSAAASRPTSSTWTCSRPGPVVRELSTVFDGYWNSEHAYPIQSLAAHELRRRTPRAATSTSACRAAADDLPVAARDPLGQSSVGSAAAPAAASSCTWPACRVLADAPAKADGGTRRAARRRRHERQARAAALGRVRSARRLALLRPRPPHGLDGAAAGHRQPRARVGHDQLARDDRRAAGALRLRALSQRAAARWA